MKQQWEIGIDNEASLTGPCELCLVQKDNNKDFDASMSTLFTNEALPGQDPWDSTKMIQKQIAATGVKFELTTDVDQ